MTANKKPIPSAIQTATWSTLAGVAIAVAGCANNGQARPEGAARSATIQRTEHGVPHITAPDLETLAYAVAYAQAQDNVCQTAQQLVTVRGERSRWFGPSAPALLGIRQLPNEQADFFIALHMDDQVLARATPADSEGGRLARGYVAGYNRYLSENLNVLPAACSKQPWVRPMSGADYARMNELAMVQAGAAALADAIVGAQPPTAKAASRPAGPVDLADAAQAMREAGLLESPLGSNAWAFGRETTANGRGLLLGNPHFPWVGVNRFYEMHLTIPGQLDVMGGASSNAPFISIGFNKDVAWSHTVSTGKRFTLHELTLVPGEPTRYLVDGQPEKMTPHELFVDVLNGDHTVSSRRRTLWTTRWGPVISLPRAGLNWTATTAYALQDANAGNTRFSSTWLAINKAHSVDEIRTALRQLGTPWVNTIAADRQGNAMYADASVVPDVDETLLARCAPSKAAAALRGPAGLFVLDGSKSDCGWRQDSKSPVPGLIPIDRLPVAVRGDWVHNSNDSFVYTNPAQTFSGISPLVGDARLDSPRTRAGLSEIPELIARGKLTPQAVQQELFLNRNFMAQAVLPDLLAACSGSSPPISMAARDGCTALAGWDRRSDLDSRGAHLFREFWRTARLIPGVYHLPFDATQPVATPAGLKMADAGTAPKVWEALEKAVNQVRAAGFALDAPLGSLQRPAISDAPIPLHGGESFEGVLNYLGNQFAPGLGTKGLRVDYGTSYVQTVTFDDRGPVAQALLTYGQSSNPASPHVTDQLQLYSRKVWPTLPFHAEDVAKAQVGPTLTLVRP